MASADADNDSVDAPIAAEPESRPGGIPLYVWVIGAVVLAIPVGLVSGKDAEQLDILPKLIIRP